MFIILQPSWAIADPICTFVFSLIVLGTTLAILKDALIVLMEGEYITTCYKREKTKETKIKKSLIVNNNCESKS